MSVINNNELVSVVALLMMTRLREKLTVLLLVVIMIMMMMVSVKIRIMKCDLIYYNLSKVFNIHYSYEAHCTKL